MPEPAHSKTRATAAIAASVLSVTGVGAAHADVQVQNNGGIASSTAVEPDNPPSATNATPIENVATQNSPQVYVEQGVVINPARSQSITVTGEGFTGGAVERYGVAVYVSEYRQYPLYALGRGSAVTMTLVPELDVDGGRFSTQLTLPAGTLDPNQQYVVATAVVDPAKGYATEDPSYNSSAPLELLPANTQDEPLNAQILSGQLEIPQDKNLVVYKVTGLGEAQAFEVMTYAYALDSQGNRILLAASPARADVVNGTLLDGIEVPGSRLEEVQAVHEDLRYVLSVEVAPSAANGYTAQEVEVPFMNGWNVQHGSAPVATAERAMAEQAQFEKKQFEEEAQPEQVAQATPSAQSEQATSNAQSAQAVAASPVEQFDHVLPENDPRRHYSLPRNTVFDRVHDTTEEQTNNTSNPVMTARLHVEETVVPENDSAKTLTLRGEGFTGVSSVHLMVSAIDEYGVATGGVIASADVSEIDDSGAFTAQVQIPGSELKPGTTYRVSAVAEDEQGTVRMVNGGFTVERDSVDSLPTTPEQDAPTVEAPAADASVPTEPAADQASVTEQKAGESGAEQKKDAPAGVQGAPAQNVSAQNTSVQKTEAQKGNAQKVEAQASGSQKVASGAQQKREQLAATGASNMLVISAAGSLSLLAGMRLSRRRRSEMQLSSRR
ncbi:adhesin [Rothia mucilaginosa]|uniref:adhesin n=1 Tax=Rothia mucilaginosa TaxID=43675 RepID=UPI0028D68D85|nr:adhesin [Rothia mucilaginosa]